MSNTHRDSEQKPDSGKLEEQKSLLELEKLKEEVKELKRLWCAKASSYFAMLPALVAIVVGAYGLFSGYFNATSAKLELQHERLQNEITAFESKKDSVSILLKAEEEKLAVMEDSARYLTAINITIQDSLRRMERQNSISIQRRDEALEEIANKRDSLAAHLGNEEKLRADMTRLQESLKLSDARINHLTDAFASDAQIRAQLGLPAVYICAVQHLNQAGKESIYLRGYHLGQTKGTLPFFLLTNEELKPIKPDSTVTVSWSDTLIVLSSSQTQSPFFSSIRDCVLNSKCTVTVFVLTAKLGFSNTLPMSLR